MLYFKRFIPCRTIKGLLVTLPGLLSTLKGYYFKNYKLQTEAKTAQKAQNYIQ